MADDLFFDKFNQDRQEGIEQMGLKLGKLLTEQATQLLAGEVDGSQAYASYKEAIQSIMAEHGVVPKDVFALADDHPVKSYFFATMDLDLYSDMLEKFIDQARVKMDDGQEWEGEPAEGEGDEDHTLE